MLKIELRNVTLWTAPEPVSQDRFPPCIRNIISKAGNGKGRHRAAAILAAFLGQAGWNETEARQLWEKMAGQSGVSDSIFNEWFGRMHCPSCSTLRSCSKGYPKLGLADLGYCQPDERCKGFKGPVEYAADVVTDQDFSLGNLRLIKTVNIARVLDWASGSEGEIELSQAEKDELEGMLKEQTKTEDKILIYTREKVWGKLRPKFLLRAAEGPRRQVLSELL